MKVNNMPDFDMRNITLRPAFMADRSKPHWFVKPGHFFARAEFDDESETWVPCDGENKAAIRAGICMFEPDYYVAEVAEKNETIWNGDAWVLREEDE